MPRWLARTLLIALALVAIGVGIYLCWPRTPRLTVEQFDRIRVGMTQAEVEAVLRCPPGDYAQAPVLTWIGAPPDALEWAADTPEPLGLVDGNDTQSALRIAICFDDGKVKEKYCTRIAYTPPPTLFERLRAWVGW